MWEIIFFYFEFNLHVTNRKKKKEREQDRFSYILIDVKNDIVTVYFKHNINRILMTI